jgi:lipid II:glycine glycyltransferase (peptidoglycan interpeptide bridge formation enzyme)
VDLTRSEDDLLAAMKSKWRYNVRLAGRHGVEVVEGDEADLATFERLMGATAQRDDFAARSAGYYAAAWRACRGAARLYLARFEGEVLAAIMVFHCGATATYLYGASSNRERQRMPNHLLQWEAMRRAKSEGCRWYDFWGIPDELGRAWTRGVDPNDIPTGAGGLWGVWNFKRGFGGEVVRTVGAWDDVLRPGRYRMAQLALAIRDRFKAAR